MNRFNQSMDMFLTPTVMNEAYFGKNPTILKIEHAISELRKLWDDTPNTTNRLFQSSKELKNLENVVRKTFGFKDVYINIDRDGVTYNAMTYSVAHIVRSSSYYNISIDNDKGIYDNSHKNILVLSIHHALISDKTFTDAEITAIILHEIGHNFDRSFYNVFNAFFAAFVSILYKNPKPVVNVTISEVMSQPAIKKTIGDFSNALSNFVDKHQLVKIVSDIVNRVISMIKIPINLAKNIKNGTYNFIQLPYLLIQAPINFGMNLKSMKSEEFADSIAAAYGYGVDLITGLEKMKLANSKTYIPNNNRIIRFLYGLLSLQVNLIELLVGTHPDTNERCRHVIIKLKKDLENSDYPISMKEALRKDIIEMEKLYDIVVSGKISQGSDINILIRKLSDLISKGNTGLGRLLPDYMV